jgi:hypothetical protein
MHMVQREDANTIFQNFKTKEQLPPIPTNLTPVKVLGWWVRGTQRLPSTIEANRSSSYITRNLFSVMNAYGDMLCNID